jgi:peptide deformylase
MTTREILLWPDPRLAEICAPVEEITPELEALGQDMLETMYAAPGRGLAAPQIGAMIRMFVMDAGWKEGKPDPMVFINPMIQEVSEDRTTNEEGCLSIPGVLTEISRPASVQVTWTGIHGQRYVQGFSGFAAACVQHEMDHLDGVVTFDHLSEDARATALAEYEGDA